MLQKLFVAIVALVVAMGSALADMPKNPPASFVLDRLGVLTPENARSLSLLFQQEQTAGRGYVVTLVTAPSFSNLGCPQDLAGCASMIAERWHLGTGGLGNRVLILAVQRDGRNLDVRVQPGRDASGVIPDAVAKRIIEDVGGDAFFRATDVKDGPIPFSSARAAALTAISKEVVRILEEGPALPAGKSVDGGGRGDVVGGTLFLGLLFLLWFWFFSGKNSVRRPSPVMSARMSQKRGPPPADDFVSTSRPTYPSGSRPSRGVSTMPRRPTAPVTREPQPQSPLVVVDPDVSWEQDAPVVLSFGGASLVTPRQEGEKDDDGAGAQGTFRGGDRGSREESSRSSRGAGVAVVVGAAIGAGLVSNALADGSEQPDSEQSSGQGSDGDQVPSRECGPNFEPAVVESDRFTPLPSESSKEEPDAQRNDDEPSASDPPPDNDGGSTDSDSGGSSGDES